MNLKEQFRELLKEIPKALLRSARGLSFEDDKRVDLISGVLNIDKYNLVLWRSKQKLKLPWEDIQGYVYMYGNLPNEDEIIYVYSYGLDALFRSKRGLKSRAWEQF